MNSEMVESVWILKPVAELVDIRIGGTPSRHVDEYWGLDVKWASAADVAACKTRYIRETTERISIMGLEKSSAKMLEKDTVLITARGTVGALCMLPEPMAFNQTCYGLVSKGEIDPTFLYFTLKARITHVKAQTYGAVFDTITASSFDNILIPAPPIEIQQRITSILSNYDDLIENNLRRIAIHEEMARAIYREWFVHFKFPGHEEVKMVDSELGGIPEGWNVDSFSSLADFQNGFAFKPKHWQEEGMPIVKIAEMKKGFGSTTKYYHGEDIDEKYHIKIGDLLFAWSASLFVCFWTKVDSLLNQHIFLVKPRPSYSRYLIHSMLKEALPRFQSLAHGTTMRHIKRSALDDVKTVIPPEHLRNDFDEFIEPLIQLSWNLHIQNETLQELKELLLPRLVSGEIDVSQIDIELFPLNTRKMSKYSDQPTLDRRLDGDDDDA